MKKKEIKSVMNDYAKRHVDGDTILQGLNLVARYLPNERVVRAAHDSMVISVKVDRLKEAGITREDVELLRDLDWSVNEWDVLYHTT
jgi:predicted exporter